MSASDEVVAKLRNAYQQWHDSRGRSVDTWVALLADDIQMRSVADGAPGMTFSAARAGKDAARGYFSALSAEWEMVHYTVHDIIAFGDRVAVFGVCAFRNLKTGKTAETHVANRWRFRDGLAVDYFELYDTAKAFAAATPDPA
ncbi:nuclear transport factor 2 family protein [Gemmata sp. JC673]|uniref:Nuclear transport factor 2 family protein n=1 Tax=Gemmata algarum TaxID=2975278 RepID=A0ABU5F1C1_9BACT|nr:nuclear transport factor 2 family protein [Gemmata algarum]MDY3561382.1 nuclear transport factor 2 family protein [Gemmata algarum]